MSTPDRSEDSEAREVVEQIDPLLLDSIEHLYPAAKYAVFDLFDNELDAVRPGKFSVINLTCSREEFAIIGFGGEGMDFEGLQNFFVWGRSGKRRKLGRYGHGGKTAMSYLAESARISCAKEQGTVWELEAAKLAGREEGLKKYQAVSRKKNRGDGYVKIELWNLKKTVDARVLKEEIANTYRRALEKKRIVVYVNGDRVEIPEIPLADAVQQFTFDIREGIRVEGWIGKLARDKQLPAHLRPGMRGYVFDRLISQGLFFGHPTPDSDPGMRFLIGEFNINSDEIVLTSAKDAFDQDHELFGQLRAKMYAILEPHVAVLEEFSEAERVPRGDRAAVDSALKAIKLGLVSLHEAIPGTSGTRKRVKVTSPEGETLADVKREPTESREPKERERRERLPSGGFSEVKFRDLGSLAQGDVIMEKGRAILVVNPNYSAYGHERRRRNIPMHVVRLGAFELARLALKDERGDPDYDITLKNTWESYLAAIVKAGRKARLL